MILYELAGGSERHPAYRHMAVGNGRRHYSFLKSAVETAVEIDALFLSQTVLKSINYHAITCLHPYAGEYRPCPVTVGSYRPPEHYRIDALMEDFINRVNRNWDEWDIFDLSAYVLWKLNHIHPFINGNGRTARAASYFVICLKVRRWLPGTVIIPELLRQPDNRNRYVRALQNADAAASRGETDLSAIVDLLKELLIRQIGPVSE